MVRHHPPGVLRIISKPAHLHPAAVIHRPQFTTGRVRVARQRRSRLFIRVCRVVCQPYRLQPDTVIGTVLCTGGQRVRGGLRRGNRTGTGGEDKEEARCLGKACRRCACVRSAPGENGSRAVRHPRHRARHITLRRPVKGQRPPKPSTTPVSTRYAGGSGGSTSSARHPLRPAEYPPRPLKAVCRQVHMRTQANIFQQHLPERA